jgi:hypothetical protein
MPFGIAQTPPAENAVRGADGTGARHGVPAKRPPATTTEGSSALMTVTIPLVAIVALIVYIAYRYMGMRIWHALVAIILGFLLAATAAAPEIRNLLDAAVHWLQRP